MSKKQVKELIERPVMEESIGRDLYKSDLQLAMDHLSSMLTKAQDDSEDIFQGQEMDFALGRIHGAVLLVQKMVDRLP